MYTLLFYLYDLGLLGSFAFVFNFLSLGDSKCSFGALSVLLMYCTLYLLFVSFYSGAKYMMMTTRV